MSSSPSTIVIPAVLISRRSVRASRIADDLMHRSSRYAGRSGPAAPGRGLIATWRMQAGRLIAAWTSALDPTLDAVIVPPAAAIGMSPEHGARILIERGRAWITQSGDSRDHLPRPGDIVRLAATGRVVVQNLGDQPLALRCARLRALGSLRPAAHEPTTLPSAGCAEAP